VSDHGVLAQRTLAVKVADPYQAGRDADANREQFPRARLELGNGGNDIEPRPHGSLGIVFVRDCIAEISQDPLRPELREPADIGSRHKCATAWISMRHEAHILRIAS